MKHAVASLRRHWPFAILMLVAAGLIFTNLGRDYLWADEGDTAVLASNIIKAGLPKAWDGVTFMDSDFGARVNRDLVMVGSPWIQYYVTAASFLLFGENTFAARFPFALAGWFTIGLVYLLVWNATDDRRAAISASILTICSIQFLLYGRQARYYALAMLFTCLLLNSFLRMRSFPHAMLYGIAAILLFHTHPIGIVLVAALGILTLVHPGFAAQRRWYWLSLPAILALTLPWLVFTFTGYSENAVVAPSLCDFSIRLVQYLIECASVTPLIGIIAISAVVLIRRYCANHHPLRTSEHELLVAILAIGISYVLAMAATQRTAALWVTGVRYTSAIIPLLAIAAALLIAHISRGRNSILISLVVVFAFTKFAQITPWIFWADKNVDPETKLVALHVPVRLIDSFLATEDYLFLRDLWLPNVGTVGECSEYFHQYANPKDLVITNYESEPFYFHTRMPQGMKIMKQDRIYDTARRLGLPDYVFGVDHARWVVWRFKWDDYLGIRWADVADRLSAEGAQITDVAEIKETVWENRENIHFRRFVGGRYLFHDPEELPPARIFQIAWPVP
jgi:4-amino-4-deoxy-L-arabinose transferase-like glycosyltransferase